MLLVALVFSLMQSGMVLSLWPVDGDLRGDLLNGRFDVSFFLGGLIHGAIFYYVLRVVKSKLE